MLGAFPFDGDNGLASITTLFTVRRRGVCETHCGSFGLLH
jgi:hypothetical protein